MEWLLYFDLFGVFVFALSGGFDGAKYHLDLLGILVLALATSLGGGIMRDAILGVHPPAAFTNETYFFTALAAGLIAFFFANRVERHMDYVRFADAIGLGVFAAIGAATAVRHELGWVGVVLMSTLTATGGGVIRDLLVREIPMILRSDFYASAAIIGGLMYMVLHSEGVPEAYCMGLAALAATSSRFVAMRYNVNLPQARR
ncbi:hypothetical protein A3715_12935 [Oleiphilus sp. HI0009]|uniref:trimeric intracellular cation channel family protein n=1 Tax=unclassified Oleiphilus TaxID=2631174 RepID=UPI0007C30EF4|nr:MULTISPECIES: trimeric intracellular cation channel family protein [unclassified Oleiphilus]KZX76402.1 hypothetical protein A3715_12935 [Oleiphilus sp. HI0009]KZY66884.1 hypothetical protein A3738_05610 [Oleiphilus sp. HI0066]KZY73867.1 hypothetical protein A3739_15080 [Oleiphilus sp. HI0067]